MNRRLAIEILLSLSFFGALANGQSQAFEVASIKPAPAVRPRRLGSVRIDRQQMTISALALSEVIAMAYHVHAAQIIGPSWLASTAFDFTIKLPDGASVDQVPVMLQNLLMDRFGMTIRRETREQPVYMLVVGKGGTKLKESNSPPDFSPPSDDQTSTVQTPMGEMKMISVAGRGRQIVGSGMSISVSSAGTRLEMSRISKLAQFISSDTDWPAIDGTGLGGDYEIVLDMPADGGGLPGASSPEIELFDAVEQQLGIKVNSSKAPIEVIVIDSIDKTPSAN